MWSHFGDKTVEEEEKREEEKRKRKKRRGRRRNQDQRYGTTNLGYGSYGFCKEF